MDSQIWPPLKECLVGSSRILEVGPGYQPRVPVGSSHFVDIDSAVVEELSRDGARVLVGNAEDLPYRSGAFDLVCAFDVLEHIKRDGRALAEIYRVLRKGGIFVLSVPLFKEYWSRFDEMVGHERRYHPSDLEATLGRADFKAEKFLCPNNLWAFIFEHRLTCLMVWLQIILDFALVHLAPAWRVGLYKFYALTPLNRMRGVGRVLWEEEGLARIENRWSVIVVCRKYD